MWFLRSDIRRDLLRVGDVGERQWRFDRNEGRLVPQQLARGDCALACLRELRPVVGDLGVVVEQSA
jgi:hypothetical protein